MENRTDPNLFGIPAPTVKLSGIQIVTLVNFYKNVKFCFRARTQSSESNDPICSKVITVIPTVCSKVGQLKNGGNFSKTSHDGESLSSPTRTKIT